MTPELEAFLAAPRPAVVAVIGRSGEPVSAPTWYRYADGLVIVSMEKDGPRHRHLLRDPRIALSVLGDDWYTHLSLVGRVTSLEDDEGGAEIDRISMLYRGEPYSGSLAGLVTARAVVERWHTFGEPGRADA